MAVVLHVTVMWPQIEILEIAYTYIYIYIYIYIVHISTQFPFPFMMFLSTLQNGIWTCGLSMDCPSLDCEEEERVFEPGQCCPRCRPLTDFEGVACLDWTREHSPTLLLIASTCCSSNWAHVFYMYVFHAPYYNTAMCTLWYTLLLKYCNLACQVLTCDQLLMCVIALIGGKNIRS